MRYGKAALHFYTWSMMVYRIVGVGVATYSLAIILVALMPLGEGNPLRDPATGNLSLTWAIVIFGGIVVVYTMIGGLWAVLMTDVLQFIVLNLAVLFVVPMLLMQVGGLGTFAAGAPEEFFTLTGGGDTWFFLAGWTAIHFFMVGAEWAFVQRFICVPTPGDARRSCWLFGGLYLVSPLLWLLPPMIWRVANPPAAGATAAEIDAMAEQAYILACRSVLPAGMVGLMVAAMFSATASMVSSQLNVFAGVLTSDIYQALDPDASERRLVWAGRGFTTLLGAVLLAVALAIPYLGGAEKVIVSITSLLVGPLLAPTLWGLLSKRVSLRAVFITGGICFAAGFIVKFGFGGPGFLKNIAALEPLGRLIADNAQTVDTLVGVVLPVAILVTLQLTGPATTAGWERVQAYEATERAAMRVTVASRLPALIVAWALAICGVGMALLSWHDPEARGVLAIFAAVLLALAGAVHGLSWWRLKLATKEVADATV